MSTREPQDQTAPPSGGAEAGPPEAAFPRARRTQRKVRTGVVTSSGMEKTVVVEILQTVRHDLYGKTYRRRRKLYAHDEANAARVGDRVLVAETRPLSKLKRWRVVEILERAT